MKRSANSRRRTAKDRPLRRRSSSAPRPTSYDVAQLAGVSQSAVSRCFRADASISEEMRAKVLEAARRLGYSPDAIARGLSTSRSGLVGVIISNLTNLYYPEVLSELNARCADRNVHVLLFTIQGESDVDRVLGHVWQYRLDGVIAAARLDDKQVHEFERRGVPLVFYNRYSHEREVNAVCCDQRASARIIVDGLIATDHKRFGLIGGPPDSIVGAERIDSCRSRLRQHGVRALAVVSGDYTYTGGRKAFAQLADKLGSTPDAVIAANDVMALGCLDAIRFDRRLVVPRDVSVVGFDGVEPSTWLSYGLATVRQPVADMAAAAVDLLFACLENPARAPEKRLFSGTLKAGTSARLAGAQQSNAQSTESAAASRSR